MNREMIQKIHAEYLIEFGVDILERFKLQIKETSLKAKLGYLRMCKSTHISLDEDKMTSYISQMVKVYDLAYADIEQQYQYAINHQNEFIKHDLDEKVVEEYKTVLSNSSLIKERHDHYFNSVALLKGSIEQLNNQIKTMFE